eukprot:SAG11_NODE_6398_length_1321_cov_2.310147_2_plen_140_part_00
MARRSKNYKIGWYRMARYQYRIATRICTCTHCTDLQMSSSRSSSDESSAFDSEHVWTSYSGAAPSSSDSKPSFPHRIGRFALVCVKHLPQQGQITMLRKKGQSEHTSLGFSFLRPGFFFLYPCPVSINCCCWFLVSRSH